MENLDKFIIKQGKPKRTIAQAIRNKYRMRKLEGEIKEFIRPSNILLHGKSGSGKTEIFRIISRLYNAPFIRVEATKYTEVGDYGEDINSIITDFYKKTEAELQQNSSKYLSGSKTLTTKIENYILKILYPGDDISLLEEERESLRAGELDEMQCYVQVQKMDSQAGISILKVKELKDQLFNMYLDLKNSTIVKDLIESKGIIIIDEIDKLVRAPNTTSSSKASDEGVQYDLLPMLDGTIISVNKTTSINTKNILFVGAGAFEKVKPTDLILEL